MRGPANIVFALISAVLISHQAISAMRNIVNSMQLLLNSINQISRKITVSLFSVTHNILILIPKALSVGLCYDVTMQLLRGGQSYRAMTIIRAQFRTLCRNFVSEGTYKKILPVKSPQSTWKMCRFYDQLKLANHVTFLYFCIAEVICEYSIVVLKILFSQSSIYPCFMYMDPEEHVV